MSLPPYVPPPMPDPPSYPPAQWPQPPAPPSGRGRGRWWLVGGVGVLLLVVVAAGGGYLIGRHSGSATPAAAPTTFDLPTSTGAAAPTPGPGGQYPPPVTLSGLLLAPEALDSLLATGGLMVDRDSSEPLTGTADPPDCMGTVAPAESTVYSESGWVAMKLQQLRQSGEQFQNDVTQAVVSFSSAPAAKAFVDAASSRWSACADKSVSATLGDGLAQTWQLASPSNADGMLTLSTTNPTVGWGCQRALTARRSVVIDVRICSASGSNQAADLATQIAKNVRGG